MEPKVPILRDLTLLILAASATAITATANTATFDLELGASTPTWPWLPGMGGSPMQAVISVTSFKNSVGDETYTFKVQDSPDGTTWTDRSPSYTVVQEGVDHALGGFVVLGFFSRARYLRVAITLAGTSPSLVLGDVYLAPITNALG